MPSGWRRKASKERLPTVVIALAFANIVTFMVMLFGLGVIGIVCWYTSKCSDEPIEKVSITVFTEKGHDYLLVDTKHGVCTIHAESCPCRKNK